MKAKSKSAKGSSFERQICSQLSLWWSTGSPEGERDDVFYRTPGSGARATSRAKRRKSTSNQYGDICASDSSGDKLLSVFRFELKRGYSGFTFQDMLDTKGISQYQKWIAQARESVSQSGSLYWMLIHRRDKRNTVAVLPTEAFDLLLQDTELSRTPVYWTMYSNPVTDEGGNSQEPIVCVLLDDLLRVIQPYIVSTILVKSGKKK
jgi:hypothetical protein